MARTDRKGRTLEAARGESGTVVVLVAVALLALLGVAALAIDVGHLYVVRGELQNAADAAALAGANQLWPHSGAATTTPRWSEATAAASTNAPANEADGAALTQYTVETGYWNLAQSPAGMQDESITPGSNDAPAVRVTVRKAEGSNGPVVNWFATILGAGTSEVAAVATGVCTSPGTILPGALRPLAISRTVADLYRGTTTTIVIGPDYLYPAGPGGSMAGQWTTLLDTGGDLTIRDLLENGNPSPVSVDQAIHLLPGVGGWVYGVLNTQCAGRDVLLPVVEGLTALEDVEAFVGFHIDYAIGWPPGHEQIVGHFVPSMFVGEGRPIGPNYGVFLPPRLVQ